MRSYERIYFTSGIIVLRPGLASHACKSCSQNDEDNVIGPMMSLVYPRNAGATSHLMYTRPYRNITESLTDWFLSYPNGI